MFFVDVLETAGLGNRSHPAGGARSAVVVDPPRDIDRVIAAAGHVAGSLNFEVEGQLATHLARMIPWDRPVTLLAGSAEDLPRAQREPARVGVDRPAAASVGSPADWLPEGTAPASFPRAAFADLAAARARGEDVVVVDVRRENERVSDGWAEGSVHLPVHEIRGRLDEVPPGRVWVHCAGGMRAAIAASVLDAAGRDVVAVDDGFEAASGAGLTAVLPGVAEERDPRTGRPAGSRAGVGAV